MCPFVPGLWERGEDEREAKLVSSGQWGDNVLKSTCRRIPALPCHAVTTMLSPFRSFVRTSRLGRLITTQSSVNPDEISHFSNLSAHWWDEHGEFEYLHKMNPVRMTFVRQKVLEAARDDGTDPNPAQVLAGLDVLDVGCGGGLLSEVCTVYHVFLSYYRTSALFVSRRASRDLVRILWALTLPRKILESLANMPLLIHDLPLHPLTQP